MKRQLLFLFLMMLPLVASAHDFEVHYDDGVTIYYNYGKYEATVEVTNRNSSTNSYKGNVVIPEEVKVPYMDRTCKVTSIGSGAFQDCSGLTSVSIPNSVTSIGSGAFENCSGLTSITIPNSVTSIGEGAFFDCFGLTSVTIGNSVTSIGGYAFCQCYSLTSVIIPNSVTSIGECAFAGCFGLTSVTIGNGVTSIGDNAFYSCSKLQKVIVSDIAAWCGIKFGGWYANPLIYAKHLYSDENTEIKDLVIPKNVTSIGEWAFNGPDIPTIVSLIENPFTITGKTSSWSPFTLNTFNNATLYVPTGTINKYKATNGWKDFVHIVEGIPSGINVVEKTKNNKTTIYDLNGVRQLEAKKGINIVNGKKVVVK